MKSVGSKRFITIALMISMPIIGSSIDAYVPSLPYIVSYFHTTRELSQLSVTIYLFSYGIFQLLFGTLSDGWGRKKVFTGGAILFTIASFVATLSPTMGFLLVMRAIQGAGMAAIGSTGRAMLTDLYQGTEFKKIMSYISLAWGSGLFLSPIIGGYLQHYFNWQATFYYLTAYGLLVSLFGLCFVETLPERHELKVRVIVGKFATIVRHPLFWGWTSMAVLTLLIITCFNIIGPFLIQTDLHYNAAVFGQVAFFIGLAWFLGNFSNRFLVKYPLHKIMPILLTIAVLISFVILLMAILFPMNLYNLVLPLLFIFAICGSIFPFAYGGPLNLFRDMAGTVSSAMGCGIAAGAGFLGSFAVLLQAENQIPMVAVYFVLTLVMTLIYITIMHRKLKKSCLQ